MDESKPKRDRRVEAVKGYLQAAFPDATLQVKTHDGDLSWHIQVIRAHQVVHEVRIMRSFLDDEDSNPGPGGGTCAVGARNEDENERPQSRNRRHTGALNMKAAIYARILLALLCLLVVTTSASAEAAWVLWGAGALISGGQTTGFTDWVLMTRYETQPDCTEAAEQLRKEPDREGTVRPGVNYEYYYKCLPDTVDPRGPRGK